MGYPIPEILVETIIRKGFQRLRDNPDFVLADVFDFLLQDDLTKYQEAEIARIKEIFTKEIAIHHATYLAMAQDIAISIEFLNDSPEQDLLSSFLSRSEESITPATIVSSVVLKGANPYDSISGSIDIDDSVDLSDVYPNHIFVDVAGEEFTILSGVNNTIGSKQIVVAAGADVDDSGNGYIKSSIDYIQYDVKGRNQHVELMVGAHSKDPLTTKYLYCLLKYFIDYYQDDLIGLGIDNLVIKGINYQQDPNYQGDFSYTKAIQISGMIEESWKSNVSTGLERAEVQYTVEKDVVDNEIADRVGQTVIITEDE